ncbi:MAG: hypothetical protein OEL87_02285 [Nanoarchaeota archaeon]|nr:hypothetical protein [Nanoarchaeota archaeon]
MIRTVISAFTLISVFFVALNYFLARKKANQDAQFTKDKEICEQAIIALERAYNTLAGRECNHSLPAPSRINWLTSARQILRYKKLKSKLKTDLYKLVCSEHEEHWRHQFYLSLQHQDLDSAAYFKGTMFSFSSENIDPRSALIIVNFSTWNQENDDPLMDVDKNDLIHDDYTLNGQHGLEHYIIELQEEKLREEKAT